MSRPTSHVHIIGICGGSGTGKSTLARAIRQRAGEAAIISQDDYYKPKPVDIPFHEYNYDHPDAFDFLHLSHHIARLRAGMAVEAPIYDYHTSLRSGTRTIPPAPLVIVEGILIMAWAELVARMDLKVFLDIDPATQLARRIARDTRERGCPEADVRRMWAERVYPMQQRYVDPARERCDLVLPESDPDAMAATVLDALLAAA